MQSESEEHNKGHWWSTLDKPDVYFRLPPWYCEMCDDTGFHLTTSDAGSTVDEFGRFIALKKQVSVACLVCMRAFDFKKPRVEPPPPREYTDKELEEMLE